MHSSTHHLPRLLLTIGSLVLCLQSNISFANDNPKKANSCMAAEDQNLACVNQINNNKIFDNDIVLGNRNAKILVIEYFAPTCSHCADYHLKTLPYIKHKYIDTGKVAYVLRECVGNKQDLDASILARCTNDSKAYQRIMHQILTTQDHWAYSKEYRQNLINIGQKHNITQQQYQACLHNDQHIESLIKQSNLAGSDPNFVGTPSFYINGKLINSDAVALIQEIERILLEKS